MKNILSFQPGIVWTGREILDWAQYQVENNTSHYNQGKYILARYGKTLIPSRKYTVSPSYETFGCGIVARKPIILVSDQG